MASTSQSEMAGAAGNELRARAGGSSAAAEGNAQRNPSNAASASAKPSDSKNARKKRNKKARKKVRRQSFAAPSEAATEDTTDAGDRPSLLEASRNASQRDSFYRLQKAANKSNTSLESEALLDHRDRTPMRSRRETMKSGFARMAQPFVRQQHRSSDASAHRSGVPRSRLAHAEGAAISEDDEEDERDNANDRTPLLTNKNRHKPDLSRNNSGFGGNYGSQAANLRARHGSRGSRASSRRGMDTIQTHARSAPQDDDYDVNNPPSMPGSPNMDDVFLRGLGSSMSDRGREAVISVDGDPDDRFTSTSPLSMRRRATIADLAERDVCFPGEMESEHEHEEHGTESPRPSRRDDSTRPRRRRHKRWPDLEVLEEWSRDEKEMRTHADLIRAKKMSEPVMIGGRLRPRPSAWHKEEEEQPFRFTYFNENLDGTIHARTISDLQDGMTFKELFLPEPAELSDDSSDEEGEDNDNPLLRPGLTHHHRASSDGALNHVSTLSQAGDTGRTTREPSIAPSAAVDSAPVSGHATPKPSKKRYGPRPTFWLDVLEPTEEEMKVLCKTFGIHQLTSEDILMNEPREKVELFPSYYFVNYRTFEQDTNSEDHLEPINMYIVVFRHGIISFHHSMSPHPANVRRRIRQLNDYMSPSADWISYAIIDDITDVYAPLVSKIEEDVDEIDEEILYMHTAAADEAEGKKKQQQQEKEPRPKSSQGGKKDRRDSETRSLNQGDMKAEGDRTMGESGGDMLRRVGECRKKVMGLYRLLGNKADVIKGFAKRCNEQWDVAPRSEIGLYLGDIQDHIVTMTGNLSHYESLLSRAHGNYVAQINIRMNERAEKNADVLGKLTVLGTIVLPMNIITGMWGMNVWVPGQEYEGDLTWFFCITAGLAAFGVICYVVAKKVYGIV